MRQVTCVIINRNGLGSHTEEIEFENFNDLKTKVDDLVEAVPFHKVYVELIPIEWEPSAEEQTILTKIENE